MNPIASSDNPREINLIFIRNRQQHKTHSPPALSSCNPSAVNHGKDEGKTPLKERDLLSPSEFPLIGQVQQPVDAAEAFRTSGGYLRRSEEHTSELQSPHHL